MASRLVSIPDTRRALGGIGHTTVYELINRGEIVKVNLGRRSFITAQSLGEYIERLTASATVGDSAPQVADVDRSGNAAELGREVLVDLPAPRAP